MAFGDIANLSALIGNEFGHTIGDPALAGGILLAFFLATMLLLRVPLDVSIAILIPLVFVIGGGVLYGAGLLTGSLTSVLLIIGGIILGYALLKFALRW